MFVHCWWPIGELGALWGSSLAIRDINICCSSVVCWLAALEDSSMRELSAALSAEAASAVLFSEAAMRFDVVSAVSFLSRFSMSVSLEENACRIDMEP